MGVILKIKVLRQFGMQFHVERTGMKHDTRLFSLLLNTRLSQCYLMIAFNVEFNDKQFIKCTYHTQPMISVKLTHIFGPTTTKAG
jgi:hypothetical protein